VPLFPEMALPVDISGPLAPLNGALPPGDTSGVMTGLESSLLAILRNYRPGDIGICELAEQLQLQLPLTDWATFCYVAEGDVTVLAGNSDPQLLYTVPEDTRAWLDGIRCRRTSGDNNFYQLRYIQPPGYGSGTRVAELVQISTAATEIWWPDVASQANIFLALPHAPALLEPGALVYCIAQGDGVSASTLNYEIVMRQTKLIRALAP